MTGRLAVLLVCALAVPAGAQDPVQVDSAHYKIEFENDCVRVLRIDYAAGDRSVMHAHPDAVAVLLTAGELRFSLPDGGTQDVQATAGEAVWSPAEVHLPENVGSGPMEVVLVELKPGRGAVCQLPEGAGGGAAGGAQEAGGAQKAGGPQKASGQGASGPQGCVGLGCGDSVPACVGMGCPE